MASNNPSCLQWLADGEVCTHTRSDPEGKFCPGCGVKFSDKRSVSETKCPNLNEDGVLCGSNLRRDHYEDGEGCEECGEDIPPEVWQQVLDWSVPEDPAKHPRSHICHQILADGTLCGKQSNSENSSKHCRSKICGIKFADRVEVREIKCPFGQEGTACGRIIQKPSNFHTFFCASCRSFIPFEIWNQADNKESEPTTGPIDLESYPRHLICHQIMPNGGMCGNKAKADAAKPPNFCKKCRTKTSSKELVNSISCPFYNKPLDQNCGQSLERGSQLPSNSTCPICKAFIPKEIWHQAKVSMTAIVPNTRGNLFPESPPASIHTLVLKKRTNELRTLLSENKADVYARTGILDKTQPLFQKIPGDNPSKFQALHLACLTGNLEAAEVLIQHGAEVNSVTGEGLTSLYLAILSGKLHIIELLLSHGANTKHTFVNNYSYIHHAIDIGVEEDLLRLILSKNFQGDINGLTTTGVSPCHIASRLGHTDLLRTLIDYGADTRVRDRQGWQPLHISIRYNQQEIINLLISQKGVDINAATADKRTGLMIACTNGFEHIVAQLIEVNADIDATDSEGRSALTITRETKNENMMLLLERGNKREKGRPQTCPATILAIEQQRPTSDAGIFAGPHTGVRHKTSEIAETNYSELKPPSPNIEQRLEQVLAASGLTDHFPSKLGIQEVMQITDESTCKSVSDRVLLFYQRLITLDALCRDTFECEPDRSPASTLQGSPSSAMELLSTLKAVGPHESTSNNAELQIHPLDFFLLAYLCGDQGLRDTFIKKTYLCRLALPVYYPTFKNDEFELLLGPLRSIILEWKAKADPTSETKNHETDAVSAPCHFVLFARVSRSERFRKSKIMNDILCKTIHPTFTHWDCPNGTRERLLTDGLVEGSWYIPSGKDSDLFSSLIMFLNLRGDFLDHLKNFQMLYGVASIFVQLVSICDFTREAVQREVSIILNNKIPVVLLIHDDKSQSIDAFNQHLQQALIQLQSSCVNNSISLLIILPTTEKGQLKNADKIKLELRQIISKFTTTPPKKSFEFLVDKIKNNDESTSINQKGKVLARNALELIDKKKGSEHLYLKIKDMKSQVPLQGDLWKKWSATQKKMNRPFTSTGESSVDTVNVLEMEMNEIRQKQLALCLHPSPLMSAFIEGLRYEEPNCDKTMNFLRWMRYFLDDNSRKKLPNFHNKYNKLWLKLRSYKGNMDDQKKVEELQHKVNKAEEEFANASFGLEHLMRELGQMYESITEGAHQYPDCSGYSDKVRNLPKRMAELIYSGQPIELMDGDATNIPLSWIKAVFKELHIKLEAKSVIVISVLGIQSSGKSTLLNTMFGLQFAVSAGRCTKGVYMQLVRVNKKCKLPFDYVCVVDTEGLRAAELGMTKFDRDNELATFVIGLGDLTIINIKGESYSEMKDVLQIVVHAFLRIKLAVEQNHQCIFIHQNVGAANAPEKMKFAGHKLQENLDEMTIEAAEQENRKGVRTFNDVIEFDCHKDVYFFPDLWHGDPPMAHANPGYHDQIAMIKKKIFLNRNSATSNQHSFWSFDKISARISDLWDAILADDFVFAFRNSLEVKAYNHLEQKYRELVIEVHKEFLHWKQTTADGEIKNLVDESKINSCKLALEAEIQELAVDIKSRKENDLAAYIKEHSHCDLMTKWKHDKVLSLMHEVESKGTYYKSHISEALENQRMRVLGKGKDSPLINELTTEACKLAERLRERSSDISPETLKQEFDKLWKRSTAAFIRNVESVITDKYIEQQMCNALYQYFPPNQSKDVTAALKDNFIRKPFDIKHYPRIPSVTEADFIVATSEDTPLLKTGINRFRRIFKFNASKAVKHAEHLLQFGLKSAFDSLEHLGESIQFTPKLITDLLSEILKTSWDKQLFPFETTTNITFEASYVPCIAAHVCRYAFPLFCQKHAKYESIEGYFAQIKKHEERIWNLFQNKYNNVKDEIICAELVKDHLKEIINSLTQELIPEEMKSMITQMYATKQCFIREILLDFVKNDRLMFSEIDRYLHYPRVFAGEWLTIMADKTFTAAQPHGPSKLGVIGSAYIPIMCQDIYKRLDHIKDTSGEELSLKEWIDHFCAFKTKSLHALASDFTIEKSQTSQLLTIKDFDKYVRDQISTMAESLKQDYLTASPKALGCKSSMYEEAADELWGCKENCPLCGEPCLDSTANHGSYPHKCLQHRPTGLNGTHFEHTNIMSLSNCNFNVASDHTYYFKGVGEPYDKFKNYQRYHPSWDINPNTSTTSSVPFWCWVYVTFHEQIALKHSLKTPEIPSEWKKITREKAIESLQVATTLD